MHQQTATSDCGATQSGLRHWAWMPAGFVMNLLFHLSRIRLARKIVRPFYLLAVWTWERLPPPVLEMGLVRRLGYRINELVLFRNVRYPNNGTYMLRNRPELDLIHDIAATAPAGSMFRIAVLGCSIGMEVYSIRWRLRDLAPELDIQLLGLEIDHESLEVARSGEFPLALHGWQLSRLSDAEMSEMLVIKDRVAYIRPQLKQNIRWVAGNACDPSLHRLAGDQDLVLANRFLCHMPPDDACNCLKNLTQLVVHGGHLFISGIDLRVRQSVMHKSGFVPVTEKLAAIHDGDPSLREGWPWCTWGLEPLDMERADWVARYAMVYRNADPLRKELGNSVEG